MALCAARASLISATAARNQVQQHPQCFLFTFSRIWNWFPWPERAWVYGHNKLEYFLQSNQCWAPAIVLLLGKLFMSPKQDALISMTLLFASVLMATHIEVASNQKNSPCFKNISSPIKTHNAKPAPSSWLAVLSHGNHSRTILSALFANSGSGKPWPIVSSEIPPKESWAIPPWGPAHTCQAPQTEVALQSCLCLNMDLRSSGGWCRAGGSSTSHWWCLQGESSSEVPAALLNHKSRAFLYYHHCFNWRDGTTVGLKEIYCLNKHQS